MLPHTQSLDIDTITTHTQAQSCRYMRTTQKTNTDTRKITNTAIHTAVVTYTQHINTNTNINTNTDNIV